MRAAGKEREAEGGRQRERRAAGGRGCSKTERGTPRRAAPPSLESVGQLVGLPKEEASRGKTDDPHTGEEQREGGRWPLQGGRRSKIVSRGWERGKGAPGRSFQRKQGPSFSLPKTNELARVGLDHLSSSVLLLFFSRPVHGAIQGVPRQAGPRPHPSSVGLCFATGLGASGTLVYSPFAKGPMAMDGTWGLLGRKSTKSL